MLRGSLPLRFEVGFFDFVTGFFSAPAPAVADVASSSSSVEESSLLENSRVGLISSSCSLLKVLEKLSHVFGLNSAFV